jgi:Putative transposase/Transposase zinc-binding domain
VARPRLEVADVVRAHRERFVQHRRGQVLATERRVLDDIATCRTAQHGGHVEKCDACGHLRVAYNSCRNRHCPKCQQRARAHWLEAHEQDVLPVEYFHVVFTIPHQLRDIALQNKKLVYNILFRASAETLSQIAADPDHLGAELGFLSVLHTWGQNLEHHPHVHCVVAGGGISTDRSQWVRCRPRFFLPVRVLGRLFRGKFLHHLRHAFEHGRLGLHGQLADLREPLAFASYLAPLYQHDWNVYAKPPFGGPSQVLRYLARYTHRVAISNHRLVAMHDDRVTFRWKDYSRGKKRTMTLGAAEFLRRFLLHLLPAGFVRIRHFGFLANRCRRDKLERCRELLAAEQPASSLASPASLSETPTPCPECKRGRMVCVLLLPVLHGDRGTAARAWADTS